MINVITQEYKEGDLAIRTTIVTFLHIPIFKFKETTTNNIIVSNLTPIKEPVKIKGFRNETKD